MPRPLKRIILSLVIIAAFTWQFIPIYRQHGFVVGLIAEGFLAAIAMCLGFIVFRFLEWALE